MTPQPRTVTCPWCNATNADRDPPPDGHGGTDCMCCPSCLRWSINEEGVLRKPNGTETLHMMTSPEARELRLRLQLRACGLAGDDRASPEHFGDLCHHANKEVAAKVKAVATLLENPADQVALMTSVLAHLAVQCVGNLMVLTGSDDYEAMMGVLGETCTQAMEEPKSRKFFADALDVRRRVMKAQKS